MEAGGAAEVRSLHGAEIDGPAVRHDDPVPGDKCTFLAVRDLAIVLADQPRALRDQHRAAGDVVINRLGNLGDDLAG